MASATVITVTARDDAGEIRTRALFTTDESRQQRKQIAAIFDHPAFAKAEINDGEHQFPIETVFQIQRPHPSNRGSSGKRAINSAQDQAHALVDDLKAFATLNCHLQLTATVSVD